MEYVVRDKGVRFVTANGDPFGFGNHSNATASYTSSTVDKTSTVDRTSPASGDKTSTVSMDITSPVSVDKTSTPIGIYIGNSLGNTSSTSDEVEQIVKALAQYSAADLDASRQLIRSCRSVCPDIQVSEITALIHRKAATVNSNRPIANPIGFLLTAVPRCCEGAAFEEFRCQQALASELEQARSLASLEEKRQQMEFLSREYKRNLAIVGDPTSPTEQVQRASKTIAELEVIFRQPDVMPE